MAKGKKAFGGYGISFKGQKKTLEELFGDKSIAPSEMTKILWRHVKKEGLGSKG